MKLIRHLVLICGFLVSSPLWASEDYWIQTPQERREVFQEQFADKLDAPQHILKYIDENIETLRVWFPHALNKYSTFHYISETDCKNDGCYTLVFDLFGQSEQKPFKFLLSAYTYDFQKLDETVASDSDFDYRKCKLILHNECWHIYSNSAEPGDGPEIDEPDRHQAPGENRDLIEQLKAISADGTTGQ